MTDIGVAALGNGCGQLQIINLACCGKVTDIGLQALGAGCSLLSNTYLYGCHLVTHAGISALRGSVVVSGESSQNLHYAHSSG